MLEQERRISSDRRHGQGAAGRKPPFLTQDGGVIYADRRLHPDRRLVCAEVRLVSTSPVKGN